jgi:hypothetical protein
MNRTIIKPLCLLFIVVYFSPDARTQVIPDSLVRKRVKEIHNPLERLLTLEPQVYQYNTNRWKGIRLPAGNLYGFAPENVEVAFPELVSYQHHSYMAGKNLFRTAKIKTVDTESLVPILVASVKEMQAELEKLRMELQMLKKGPALLQ